MHNVPVEYGDSPKFKDIGAKIMYVDDMHPEVGSGDRNTSSPHLI